MLRPLCGLGRLPAGPGAGPSVRLARGAEMPKKAGATNKGKSESKKPETSLPPLGPVAADPKGCVTIAIHAKPGSKQNAVTDVTAEAVSVAIAAPPSEGEANAELCRYLSKVLDLRKSDVVLDKPGTRYSDFIASQNDRAEGMSKMPSFSPVRFLMGLLTSRSGETRSGSHCARWQLEPRSLDS
nr:UPF0235 protein C15orf40 homolog isoform X2 [Equus asinus]